MDATTCVIVDAAGTGGQPCGAPVDAGTPMPLCAEHLLAAYEWVARDVGTTDRLPSPCLACGSRLGVRYPSGWLCAVCEWKLGDLPDDHAAPPRVDVVYYLRFRDLIKIGTSANPRQRFTQLRFDEVLAFERGGRALEQRRHAQFATHRIPRSEWFEAHDALRTHIRAVNDTAEDPWEKYTLWLSQRQAASS